MKEVHNKDIIALKDKAEYKEEDVLVSGGCSCLTKMFLP